MKLDLSPEKATLCKTILLDIIEDRYNKEEYVLLADDKVYQRLRNWYLQIPNDIKTLMLEDAWLSQTLRYEYFCYRVFEDDYNDIYANQ